MVFRFVQSMLPLIFLSLGIIFLSQYNLDNSKISHIRSKIEERSASRKSNIVLTEQTTTTE
jgi:Na+/melibiose symporter-like transporter